MAITMKSALSTIKESHDWELISALIAHPLRKATDSRIQRMREFYFILCAAGHPVPYQTLQRLADVAVGGV
jgi:hypothetical protein